MPPRCNPKLTRSLAALLPMRRHAMAPMGCWRPGYLVVGGPLAGLIPPTMCRDGHEQDSHVPESAKPRRVHGRGHLHDITPPRPGPAR